MTDARPERFVRAGLDAVVTVIVPVYKVEDLLRRCVDSILIQTHPRLDVILVDDGSPDRCGEICDEYSRLDSRVTVLHQANGGLSAARNAGLDLAHGEYVTFVDSDDWIHPDLVRDLLHLAMAHDAEITMSRYTETSVEEPPHDVSGASAIEFTNVEALQELLGPRYINMVVSWGKLYRTRLFDGVRFPEGRFHEDEFTTHRLLHRANRIVLTDAPLYNYWQRGGSITSSYSHRRRADVREAFRARASFLMHAGLADQGNATYTKVFWMLVRDRRRTRISAASRQLQKALDREIRELRNEVWVSSSASELKLRVLMYSLVPGVMDWLAIFKEEDPPPSFGSEPHGEVG